MSIYLKSSIAVSEDGLSSKHVAEGVTATALDGVVSEAPDVELADEPEGEKPLKAHTVDELRDIAKAHGASAESVGQLSKPKLLEAIERLTHTDD